MSVLVLPSNFQRQVDRMAQEAANYATQVPLGGGHHSSPVGAGSMIVSTPKRKRKDSHLMDYVEDQARVAAEVPRTPNHSPAGPGGPQPKRQKYEHILAPYSLSQSGVGMELEEKISAADRSETSKSLVHPAVFGASVPRSGRSKNLQAPPQSIHPLEYSVDLFQQAPQQSQQNRRGVSQPSQDAVEWKSNPGHPVASRSNHRRWAEDHSFHFSPSKKRAKVSREPLPSLSSFPFACTSSSSSPSSSSSSSSSFASDLFASSPTSISFSSSPSTFTATSSLISSYQPSQDISAGDLLRQLHFERIARRNQPDHVDVDTPEIKTHSNIYHNSFGPRGADFETGSWGWHSDSDDPQSNTSGADGEKKMDERD